MNDERRKIVDERIKAKEEMEILQKEKSQEQKIQELQVSKENKQKSENKAKEKNSTISDKDGENSTKVKEPIIPYSVLKDNGITFNLDKGDDR